MRNEELAALIGSLVFLIIMGYVAYRIFRHAKWIFLPKSRIHIAIGIMLLGAVLLAIGAVSREKGIIGSGMSFTIIGLFASALSVFIAKLSAEKYQPYLRKGKTTTAEQLMASLKKKNVDTVLFELNCLFDRGYLPGFSVNMESHAVTPVASQGSAAGIKKMINSTISTIKGTSDAPTICKKCGAPTLGNGATNCEFCGAPISR